MLNDASGNQPGTDPGTRGRGTWSDDSFADLIDLRSADGSDGVRNDRGLVNVGLESNHDPDSTDEDSFSVDFGDIFGDDDDDLPDADADADEHELGFSANSEDLGDLGIDLSPWAPLLGMLDSTEPEAPPGDRPFTPSGGVEGAHALELRAESMLHYSERGAERTGELDRTEVGLSDDNRDVVAGRDEVEIDGMLEEHTGHGLVHVADEVEMNVGGPLRMHAHLEDNIIMAGVMRDEFAGGTFITAAMSDDMAAGLGLRCTAPLDVWAHGLVGMEERPGTCASDGILNEIAGTLYEREYGPSAHVAAVARLQGTVTTTMKTGFRPLMKVALGVRNLIPGGGGGGSADASPPAAPPAPGGAEAAGAATLTAAEGGGALGRGVAGGSDTDEIITVVRTAESASDTADVENLQHPASTADNLDDLARVDVEGEGYRQVGEIYGQSVPAGGWVETEDGELHAISYRNESLHASQTLDTDGAHRLADSDPDSASPLPTERHVSFAEPDGASASAADAGSPPASGRPLADTTPPASSANPASTPVTPNPKALDLAEPGTEEFDFGKTYDSLRDRQQYYRDHAKWPGNVAVTESVGAIDDKAADLFQQGLGGSLDDLPLDPGSRTLAIRAELDNMALRAEAAGDTDRLARIRGAIDELDVFVHDTAVDIAVRADEFPGQALGSQRVPLDADLDTDKLRSWFQEKMANAEARMAAAPAVPHSDEEMLAQMLMGDEALYYRQMIKSLDKGVNPLTESREMIAFHRLEVEDYYHSIAEPAAASGSSAPGSVHTQPLTVYKLNLYNELQAFLVAKLSDPQFMRSAAVTDVDLFAPHARVPLEAGLDLLEPDTLRLSANHEVLPPLPAPSASGRASGLEDARNASFSRSALEASEETLVRRVLDFGGLDAPGPSRQTSSGADSGFGSTPATSPGFGRTPPDNALPPVVEEQSGRWIVEPTAELDASPATSDDVSPPAQHGGTSSQSSAVSWDAGLREAGDSEVGPVAGDAGDAQTSDLFRPASEPVDEDAGEVQHVRAAGEESGDGSPGAASDGTGGTDANPAGAVSEPTDSFTSTSGVGTGTEPGSSGTSPGTLDPVATRAEPFEASGPYLRFDADGDGAASDNPARDDFEVERAMNENRPPRELDGSSLGRLWARPVTNFRTP